jgi:TfoX/Sxy family transcriptional regulator of competence genes
MAYDHHLAERIRHILNHENFVEKKMFGGVGFLVNGNMACRVYKNNLIVRVGKEHYSECLERPTVIPFDITRKPMTGWIQVIPAGIDDDQTLETWIRIGLEYVLGLPAKN